MEKHVRADPFILLCATGLFAVFSSTISKSPVLPLFSSYLGADPSGVGLIASISAFTGVIASIPAGILSDRFGRKKMLLFSAIVFSTAPFLYLTVTELWQLAIIRFYHGLATAIFIPVAMALISDLFYKERGERMGWFSTATLMGRFMAPIAGGSIIGLLAFNPGLGYKVVYLVCGVVGILALLLTLRIEPSSSRFSVSGGNQKNGKTLGEILKAFKTVISNRGIVITSLVEASILFAYGTFETFLPLYSIEMGLSVYEVGIFLSSQVIILALTKPIMGRFSDKHGRKPQISAGTIIGAVCIGSFLFSKSFWPLLVLSMLFGLSMSIVTSATPAFIADMSRRETHGSAMGVLGSIMDMGHTTGPVVSGVVAAYFGLSRSFMAASLVLILALIIFNLSIHEEKM